MRSRFPEQPPSSTAVTFPTRTKGSRLSRCISRFHRAEKERQARKRKKEGLRDIVHATVGRVVAGYRLKHAPNTATTRPAHRNLEERAGNGLRRLGRRMDTHP